MAELREHVASATRHANDVALTRRPLPRIGALGTVGAGEPAGAQIDAASQIDPEGRCVPSAPSHRTPDPEPPVRVPGGLIGRAPGASSRAP